MLLFHFITFLVFFSNGIFWFVLDAIFLFKRKKGKKQRKDLSFSFGSFSFHADNGFHYTEKALKLKKKKSCNVEMILSHNGHIIYSSAEENKTKQSKNRVRQHCSYCIFFSVVLH